MQHLRPPRGNRRKRKKKKVNFSTSSNGNENNGLFSRDPNPHVYGDIVQHRREDEDAISTSHSASDWKHCRAFTGNYQVTTVVILVTLTQSKPHLPTLMPCNNKKNGADAGPRNMGSRDAYPQAESHQLRDMAMQPAHAYASDHLPCSPRLNPMQLRDPFRHHHRCHEPLTPNTPSASKQATVSGGCCFCAATSSYTARVRSTSSSNDRHRDSAKNYWMIFGQPALCDTQRKRSSRYKISSYLIAHCFSTKKKRFFLG